MNYKTEINGIEVNVDYTNDNIENIFIPILKYAKKLYEEKKKRVLVMLAAPPGAGKSTLLSFLKHLSESNNDLTPITTIGMDGFHRYQDYLLTHDMERDTIVFPKFDKDRCIGCGRCVIACADGGHQAIKISDDRKISLDGSRCVGCHLCVLVCPEEAIGSSRKRIHRSK